MNKEVKTKWIEALRSGNYQQAKGYLRCGDKFCCLGVLSDIHAKEFELKWEGDTYGGEKKVLPTIVFKWAEVKDPNPEIPSERAGLGGLNDGGRTFAEIADMIEKEL